MRMVTAASRRSKMIAAGVAVTALAATGLAGAASVNPPTNGVSKGRGINQFGMIGSSIGGKSSISTYKKGFFCDLSVKSASSTGCEVGEKFKKAPGTGPHDPLFALVPVGFPVKGLECPANLVCVDHPGTLDQSRLAGALKPLFPNMSLKALAKSLENAPPPGHNHFLTTLNGGKAEWWAVNLIAVTDQALYQRLSMSRDFGEIKALLAAKDKRLMGPVPTNVFLFFSAKEM